MKTTNQFIESQQGEYGEWDIEIDGVKYAGKRAIQQIIKNTGEELMRTGLQAVMDTVVMLHEQEEMTDNAFYKLRDLLHGIAVAE